MVIARAQRRTRDAAIRLSTVDSLTGLFNRTFFFAAIEREIARSARSGRGFCLLMMDLDELKSINDRLGHFHGDRVLRGVGEVITQGVRQIDTAARYGGDEFVVLLPETDPTGAFVLAEKIRLGVNARWPSTCRPGSPQPSLSIGVVAYPDDGRTADELIISADGAMYASKRAGKDRVTGVPMPAAGRPVDAGVASLRERHRPTTPAPTGRPGFSTRAIRAASRIPKLDQTPTSVPIYQTATFASADADELGRVAADGRAGLCLQPHLQPDHERARRAPTRSWPAGRPGVALASGMGAIHAALASLRPGRRPDRRPDRDLRLDPAAAAADVRRLRRPGRHRRHDRPRRGRRGARRRADPGPLRRDHRQPDDRVADHAALAELAHRHGATYVVDNTFASPYVCRPLELGADLVVESATKFLGGHSDVIAGVVAGSAELIAGVERVQIDTGATLGPLEAFLVLRGILTLAIRVERHAATAAALGGLARASGRRACRPLSGSAEPSPARRRAAPVPARRRRRDAGLRGRGRPRRRPGGHRRADAPRADRLARAASTRWSSTRRRPRTASRPRRSCSPPGSPRACSASRSGSRTSRTCRRTSRRPSLRRATLDGRPVPALGAV